MPKLTVFLIRSGETEEEVVGNVLRLHQRIDPALTENGYKQAQKTMLDLVSEICDRTPIPENRGDSDNDGVIDPLRNLACFSAPLKACQATACMLSAAGMASQDKLTWRYTTVEAAKSPAAVPVITVNDLARQYPEIQKCGGVDAVVNAGLLHCAAGPWNDARNKCAFMKVAVQEIKSTAQDFVTVWKDDRTINPPRRVLDVQYLRLAEEDDPWSLEELTPKINVTVDMLEPKKYLTPPRKGNLECKLPGSAANAAKLEDLKISPEKAVRDCVWKARQVGCDTVVFTVPGSTLECMVEEAGASATGITACSVLTLSAVIDDDSEGAAGIHWEFVGLFDQVNESIVPIFPGPVDCIVKPPEDKDPASVPANQWSKFPPPEPENIPDDYPDLPPFASALSEPVPNVKPPVSRMEQAPTSPGGRGRGRAPGRGHARGGRGAPGSPRRAPASPGRHGRSPRRAPTTSGRAPASPTRREPNGVHHAASPTRLPNAARHAPPSAMYQQ